MTAPLKNLWDDFTYKTHQVAGVHWLLARDADAHTPGGILADEMGLGKTIQMAGLLRNSARRPREETLLVAPVAVLEQWKTVLQRAKMTVLVPRRGTTSWDVEHRGAFLAARVSVIGYEAALRNPGIVTGFVWDRIIYDEAHRLASDNTYTALCRLIERRSTWMLTGTPIVNKMGDLMTLLEMIGVEKIPVGATGAEAMKGILKTYLLARTMDQLRVSMPDAPPVPEIHRVMLDFETEEEAEFYRGMSGMITRRWKALAVEGGAGAALERLRLFMRLRQLSLHPQIYIAGRKRALKGLYTRPDWATSSTKFEAIYRMLDSAATPDRWIIFCHFHDEMTMLAARLRQSPSVGRVQLYNGAMSPAQKHAVVEASKKPAAGHEVLLVQLQSGGVGLNLQHFNRIIFSGPWWTAALMEQAIARAVRIGQKEVVKVYHMALEEEAALNIDAYMTNAAESKGHLCREVLARANTAVRVEDLAAGATEGVPPQAAEAVVHVIDQTTGAAAAAAVVVVDSEDEEPGDPTA
jgi:SNF2 family DNA or RNA helicase